MNKSCFLSFIIYLPHKADRSCRLECVNIPTSTSFQHFMSLFLTTSAQFSLTTELIREFNAPECSEKYLYWVVANSSGPAAIARIIASAYLLLAKHKDTAASIFPRRIACVIRPSSSKEATICMNSFCYTNKIGNIHWCLTIGNIQGIIVLHKFVCRCYLFTLLLRQSVEYRSIIHNVSI
jgi:hypothetical protein